ncbi:transposase, partial [Wolbachia pipientis]|uniref:transposase family protein n=1 Tax=Wolbachia pipientis TaxID=955 RepID=UPI001651A44F
KEQKKENRTLMSHRAIVENVIGLLKRFKIISDRYRNRRKRFGLRFNLIAAIHNFELLT